MHYRNIKTLQSAFLERYSDGSHALQVESGTAYFSRPGRMRWEYESPEEKVFIADGKTVWFYVPVDRTVTRAPMKESTDWRTPLALLTGKAKLSQLCDRIELDNSRPAIAGNSVLKCLPRGSIRAGATSEDLGTDQINASQQFDHVFMELNPTSGELAGIRIIQAGGVQLEYRFGNWKENLPLENALFRFQVPAGVAVVDESQVALP
jgi:outer membrane lipoprotein carrier protein